MLILPTEASLWGPGATRHFLNHCDCCIPVWSLPSFFFVVVTPTYPLTTSHLPQALEGAPSDQLMQQTQMPQFYAQQPWVPKTSVSGLSRASQLKLCSSSTALPFSSSLSHLRHHSWPPFISLHQCHYRCFMSEGSFPLISLPPSHKQDYLNTWTVQQSCTISKVTSVFMWELQLHAHSFYSARSANWERFP